MHEQCVLELHVNDIHGATDCALAVNTLGMGVMALPPHDLLAQLVWLPGYGYKVFWVVSKRALT